MAYDIDPLKFIIGFGIALALLGLIFLLVAIVSLTFNNGQPLG